MVGALFVPLSIRVWFYLSYQVEINGIKYSYIGLKECFNRFPTLV